MTGIRRHTEEYRSFQRRYGIEPQLAVPIDSDGPGIGICVEGHYDRANHDPIGLRKVGDTNLGSVTARKPFNDIGHLPSVGGESRIIAVASDEGPNDPGSRYEIRSIAGVIW
jgi:hypothetical protein